MQRLCKNNPNEGNEREGEKKSYSFEAGKASIKYTIYHYVGSYGADIYYNFRYEFVALSSF